MKKLAIYLYAAHDLDLVSVCNAHEFHFTKAVYCVLKAFANKEHFIIEVPSEKEVKFEQRRYRKIISFHEEKDREVIEMLDKITPGYRNNFIKNLLRLYLVYPATEPFFKDQSQIFDVSFLRTKSRVVKAAEFKKTYSNKQKTKSRKPTYKKPSVEKEEKKIKEDVRKILIEDANDNDVRNMLSSMIPNL